MTSVGKKRRSIAGAQYAGGLLGRDGRRHSGPESGEESERQAAPIALAPMGARRKAGDRVVHGAMLDGRDARDGGDPPAPDLRPRFVYGLTEWARPKLRDARAVANPGCFATAAELALLPLAEAGLLRGPVIVDGKTGSSGAGADPLPTTHHPARAQGFWTYKPLAHQHTPEIAQALVDAGAKDLDLTFVPHSAPMVRGIFATAYATVPAADTAQVESLYRERYSKEPFVRFVTGSPDVNVVAGSNFADVSVAVRGTRVVAFCALDNLVKGGAGQAVQNLNVMMGWPEREGLGFPGMMP